jgi:hypothetical protein
MAARLYRRAILALALTSAIGATTVLAAAVGTGSILRFDPFSPTRTLIQGETLASLQPSLARPPIRDPFRPPTRSPFIP